MPVTLRCVLFLLLATVVGGPAWAVDPGQTPAAVRPLSQETLGIPGHNVHVVSASEGYLFLRGAAPTTQTMSWLLEVAKKTGLPLTMVDLRVPVRDYDKNGEGGRLSPATEKGLTEKAGHTYVPRSALAKTFGEDLAAIAAQPRGIVYLHCQYGVNRTGFAIGRLHKLTGMDFDRTGLGDRDFKQGVAYQK